MIIIAAAGTGPSRSIPDCFSSQVEQPRPAAPTDERPDWRSTVSVLAEHGILASQKLPAEVSMGKKRVGVHWL